MNDAANVTGLPQAMHSWHLGANITRKARMFMSCAGEMVRYRKIRADVTARDYQGFRSSA